MKHFVYLLISFHKNKLISYVGYTNNVKKRLKLHNDSKGAKFTKGKKWRAIYKKKFKTKSDAMKYEYFSLISDDHNLVLSHSFLSQLF